MVEWGCGVGVSGVSVRLCEESVRLGQSGVAGGVSFCRTWRTLGSGVIGGMMTGSGVGDGG